MKIQNRQKVLVVVTITLLVLYVGNLAVYGPLVNWWKSRQDKIKDLRQQVSQGNALVKRESVIRGEWAHMRDNALPNDSSQAEQQVIRAFNNWSSDSGVVVNSITPQWQNDQSDYSTLDCRVEASGDISTLSRFLYEIENDPMPLQLASIEMSSTDDRGQQLSLGLEVNGLALISPKP